MVIARLRGSLLEVEGSELIVDVNGVGYRVTVPDTAALRLPGVGNEVVLYVHTHVREDTFELFGFVTKSELRLFETVVTVSGIGPRLALAILSHASVDTFVRAVLSADTAVLTKIPGIGKKTAARILLELKDKLGGETWAHTLVAAETSPPISTVPSGAGDAIEALMALGYREDEARKAVETALAQLGAEETDVERIIKVALGRLDRVG